MIDRLRGRELALQVARALHYDGARFLDDPTMPQFERDPRDAIVFLNAAYGWDRGTLGVALEDVARRQNIPTAEFAAKRLEYRPHELRRWTTKSRSPRGPFRAYTPFHEHPGRPTN